MRVDGDVYLGIVDGVRKVNIVAKGVERPQRLCNTVAIQASHYASAAVGSPP